jgi:hypothetical protein
MDQLLHDPFMVSSIELPATLETEFPPNRTHIFKRLVHKKPIKRIYSPPVGIPNGPQSVSVTANHLCAIFGQGGTESFATECLILEDAELNKARSGQISYNLNRSLLIEANVFVHKVSKSLP